jgi:hypothetical protein
MGLFKQMKDLKQMAEAAPGIIQQADELQNRAQEYAVAAQAQQAAFGVGTAEVESTPIAGVSIELYADISKDLAGRNRDRSQAAEVAASKGVSPANWSQAVAGWNERIQTNPALARRFNQLYTGG